MIFGYFHVLLTEYLAITLTMLNIFLAYKWDSVVKGRQKIFYAIYFVFSVVLAYQLKQPYFILALSPVFISAIISVIKNHKWKNITYRFGTVILSLVFMFASAFAWNKIMEKGNVDLNSGRDSGSLFSTSLTEAVRLEKDGSNTIAGSLGKLFSAFASNPFGIIGEYLKNYCATTSICIIESPDGVRYFISGQIDLLRSFENSVIGYRTFTENDNIFELSEGLKPLAESYDTGDDKGIIAKFFRAGGYVSDILFKFSTFLSPVFLILVLVFTKNFYKKNPNIYNISVICLGTAVIQLLANSFVGLIIDRYSVEIFVPALIGIAGFFILCFYKNTKKSN